MRMMGGKTGRRLRGNGTTVGVCNPIFLIHPCSLVPVSPRIPNLSPLQDTTKMTIMTTTMTARGTPTATTENTLHPLTHLAEPAHQTASHTRKKASLRKRTSSLLLREHQARHPPMVNRITRHLTHHRQPHQNHHPQLRSRPMPATLLRLPQNRMGQANHTGAIRM